MLFYGVFVVYDVIIRDKVGIIAVNLINDASPRIYRKLRRVLGVFACVRFFKLAIQLAHRLQAIVNHRASVFPRSTVKLQIDRQKFRVR